MGLWTRNQCYLLSAIQMIPETLRGRPSLIISIGRQRFEVRVNTEITPLHHGPAEVIPIDQGTEAQNRE